MDFTPTRIDTHVHAILPRYRESLVENGIRQPDGMPGIPAWSVEGHIEMMKKAGIAKAILSISSPGTHLKPGDAAQAQRVTRAVNDDYFKVCSAYPQQLEFFASLPLPEVAASIKEIDYAIDELGCKGFAVMSNANGVYFGDPSLDAVYEKLNQRKAIVFIHPTTTSILQPDETGQSEGKALKVAPLPRIPAPMLEFMFDETRAVINLLLSGTVTKYPNITYIMSHAACALPPLIERASAFSSIIAAKEGGGGQEHDLRELLRTRFYFDLAGFPFPDQIHGLLRLVGPDRLLYGSDYPFTPENVVLDLAKKMDQGIKELKEVSIQDVYQENARKLFGLD